MGCFDVAEVCRQVGALVLVTLSKPPSSNLGLYRGDGHGALWNTACTEVDWIRKDVVEVFGFLSLINKHFPKGTKPNKIFNRSRLKLN